MCSVQLAFDVAQKEVIWSCKIKPAGRPGVPETPDSILNLKIGLLNKWYFNTYHHHAQCYLVQMLSTAQISMQILETVLLNRLVSQCADITRPPSHVILQYQFAPFGTTLKAQ
jgi:hypothetical protein